MIIREVSCRNWFGYKRMENPLFSLGEGYPSCIISVLPPFVSCMAHCEDAEEDFNLHLNSISRGHRGGDKHCTTSPTTSHAIRVMRSSSRGLTHFPVMSANQLPVCLPMTADGEEDVTSTISVSSTVFLSVPPPCFHVAPGWSAAAMAWSDI